MGYGAYGLTLGYIRCDHMMCMSAVCKDLVDKLKELPGLVEPKVQSLQNELQRLMRMRAARSK